MKPLTVIFIGPQGSGKGTQVDMLIAQLRAADATHPITHVQTGKPFRDLAEKGGYTAQVVKTLIESGSLVPNVLTNALVVQEFINGHVDGAHVVFDGYPRDIEQAKTCDEIFKLYNRGTVSVVYLDTPEEVVTARMLKRGRSDDTEETIKERLRQYRAVTEPLIEYYEARGDTNVYRIDGAADMETVKRDILSALGVQ